MAGVHSGQILAGSSDLLLVVRYTRLVGVAALEQALQVVTGEVRPKLFSSTSLNIIVNFLKSKPNIVSSNLTLRFSAKLYDVD